MHMCAHLNTHITHVFVSQMHSALTLAHMTPMASSHSTQCLILRKWERPMHTCIHLHMHNVDPSWSWARPLNLSIGFLWTQIFPLVTPGQMGHWDPRVPSAAGTDLSHFHTHTHSSCWHSDPHKHTWVENGRQ